MMFPVLAGDIWQNVGNGLDGFFRNGLGGPGAAGFGIAILVIGFVFAGISFAVHKFNCSLNSQVGYHVSL